MTTMISNGAAKPVAPLAPAVCVVLDTVDRIRAKSERPDFVVGGRKIVDYRMNVDVKGSSARAPGKVALVYKDIVGRLTLEPLGEAVGVLLRGGHSGRLCHVGLFA